ncbi:MAG TPA: polysaccharide pyruvyl transferase family protein [Fimbriimonadaceae bacterium]
MGNLLVAGHFGCGNIGDDAIMVGFAHGIHRLGLDITVMSGAPEETFRYFGYSSIPRMDMGAFDQALAQCDALVFAGGSVFQDATSVKSVYYYSNLVTKAKKAKKKVFMVGQGVGPLTSFFGKKMAVGAFNASDVIVVRDPTSKATLKTLGVKTPTKVAADLAFLLPQQVPVDESMSFNVAGMRSVGVAPRPFGKDKKATIELFGELCRLLFQAKMMPVLIEMDKNYDGPLITEIEKQQGGKIPDLRKQTTPTQMQGRIARMDGMIAMRLHAGILAATVGIPPFMISYDPKVVALSKMLDIGGALNIENLTPQRLFDTFMAFQKDRDRHVKILERKKDELRKEAEVNIQVIAEGLGRA